MQKREDIIFCIDVNEELKEVPKSYISSLTYLVNECRLEWAHSYLGYSGDEQKEGGQQIDHVLASTILVRAFFQW